mgnify:CR=1 FL=1
MKVEINDKLIKRLKRVLKSWEELGYDSISVEKAIEDILDEQITNYENELGLI